MVGCDEWTLWLRNCVVSTVDSLWSGLSFYRLWCQSTDIVKRTLEQSVRRSVGKLVQDPIGVARHASVHPWPVLLAALTRSVRHDPSQEVACSAVPGRDPGTHDWATAVSSARIFALSATRAQLTVADFLSQLPIDFAAVLVADNGQPDLQLYVTGPHCAHRQYCQEGRKQDTEERKSETVWNVRLSPQWSVDSCVLGCDAC
jgi:hypothetical protein